MGRSEGRQGKRNFEEWPGRRRKWDLQIGAWSRAVGAGAPATGGHSGGGRGGGTAEGRFLFLQDLHSLQSLANSVEGNVLSFKITFY